MSNLNTLAAKCGVSLTVKDNVYSITTDLLKIEVTIQPKWVGIELTVRVDGEELFYQTDTDLYDVSDPKQAEFREEIALDVNAIIVSLLNDSLLVGTYKNRPSMIFPMQNGAVQIKKGRFAFSDRHFDSVDKASSAGSYSPLKLPG